MQITDRRPAYNGHFKVSLLTLRDDAGTELKRERFEPGRAVAALVYDTARQLYVLARQYRVGPEAPLLELAAGMIDGAETAETAVRREIQEELGYEVDKLDEIVAMWPSPGTSAERITVFYAEVSHRNGAGGGLLEENENIEMVELSWESLLAAPLTDAKTLLAVQWARLRG